MPKGFLPCVLLPGAPTAVIFGILRGARPPSSVLVSPLHVHLCYKAQQHGGSEMGYPSLEVAQGMPCAGPMGLQPERDKETSRVWSLNSAS